VKKRKVREKGINTKTQRSEGKREDGLKLVGRERKSEIK